MNIEIHQPELEALIHQRMASGAFRDVEDALIQALKSAPPPQPTIEPPSKGTSAVPERSGNGHESFVKMLDSVRGLLTDEEVDTLFKRDPSVDRHIDLS